MKNGEFFATVKSGQIDPAPEERYICSQRITDQTIPLQRSVIFVKKINNNQIFHYFCFTFKTNYYC